MWFTVDTSTGRNKGFGFVTLEDSADAQDAIRNTDGAELLGRTLRVELSTGITVCFRSHICSAHFISGKKYIYCII